jgi:hypothetical protein
MYDRIVGGPFWTRFSSTGDLDRLLDKLGLLVEKVPCIVDRIEGLTRPFPA